MKQLIILLLLAQSVTAQQYDILIRNGKIIDGTGNSWFYADVAVKDGKIISIGKLLNATATKTIDAKGLIVAPGFIDVHGHIEAGVFETPTADNYIYDGVTTVITGNCGGSTESIKGFFHQLDSVKTSINIATLFGHNTVRREVMGLSDRKATAAEQQKMEAFCLYYTSPSPRDPT